MHQDKWIFYTDLFGRQRWERLDPTGLTVADSESGFATLADAVADASLRGYLPGEERIPSCSFEWRCNRITAVTDSDPIVA